MSRSPVGERLPVPHDGVSRLDLATVSSGRRSQTSADSQAAACALACSGSSGTGGLEHLPGDSASAVQQGFERGPCV
jgi:hypothetical protein